MAATLRLDGRSLLTFKNTPAPRAGPHRPLLPVIERGVRTWGTHKVYPGPIPFDSPCYHGSITPTIKPSESFWNAQSSYFSLLPGHCACRKSALSMAALCRAGRVRRLHVQTDPHPAFEARCRTHPPCWKPRVLKSRALRQRYPRSPRFAKIDPTVSHSGNA